MVEMKKLLKIQLKKVKDIKLKIYYSGIFLSFNLSRKEIVSQRPPFY